MKECILCKTRQRKDFSNAQWKKSKGGYKRRCTTCIESGYVYPESSTQLARRTAATKEQKMREAQRCRGKEKLRQQEQERKRALAAKTKLDRNYNVLKHCVQLFLRGFDTPVQHLVYADTPLPDYLVTEKADGQRCLVLCDCTGAIWRCIQAEKKSIDVLPKPHFVFRFEKMTYERVHATGYMLFEAEHVRSRSGDLTLLYDMLDNGQEEVPQDLLDRQSVMDAFVSDTGLTHVRVKTFVPAKEWAQKTAGSFDYPTDGLVFVPVTRASYRSEDSKYKWKPVPTADLLVSASLSERDEDGKLVYPVYALMVVVYPAEARQKCIFSEQHPYLDCCIKVGMSHAPSEEMSPPHDDTSICEYRFCSASSCWIFVRRRPDKSQPNRWQTADMVLRLTIEPIQLRERVSDPRGYCARPMQNTTHFHSLRRCHRLLKRLLYNMYGWWGCSSLEVASGAGSDQVFWHEVGFDRVLAVDKDAQAVELAARSRSSAKFDFVVADLSRDPNALQGALPVDVVFCHFAIHYFMWNDGTFACLISNIKHCLRPGGRVVVTFMDADRTHVPLNICGGDGETEFSLKDAGSERLDVYVRSIGVEHREPRVTSTTLVRSFALHGLEVDTVATFDHLVPLATSASADVRMSDGERRVSGLYSCAVLRLPAKPPSALHPLFEPQTRLCVQYLRIPEMMIFAATCTQTRFLVLRQTRLSDVVREVQCRNCGGLSPQIYNYCNECGESLTYVEEKKKPDKVERQNWRQRPVAPEAAEWRRRLGVLVDGRQEEIARSAKRDYRCAVCGCSKERDEGGERVCWCDSCWTAGCNRFESYEEYQYSVELIFKRREAQSKRCKVCGCSTEKDEEGERVCWCDSCCATGCNSNPKDEMLWCPCIGQYRLPRIPTKPLISFLFSAFGADVMKSRSWYYTESIQHHILDCLWEHAQEVKVNFNITNDDIKTACDVAYDNGYYADSFDDCSHDLTYCRGYDSDGWIDADGIEHPWGLY